MLEHGLRIERDLPRAAKYSRMSAEMNNGDGMNHFGICLERGIGIQANIDLAVEYYRRAAATQTAQTILDSASSTAAVSPKTFGWPLNITTGRRMAAIRKLS
jgi:TPR repeat protein